MALSRISLHFFKKITHGDDTQASGTKMRFCSNIVKIHENSDFDVLTAVFDRNGESEQFDEPICVGVSTLSAAFFSAKSRPRFKPAFTI